jgi:phosphoserine phosphatase RsbU/P
MMARSQEPTLSRLRAVEQENRRLRRLVSESVVTEAGLAEANARAAEVMADLEESIDRERAMSGSLAEANARAAEILADLEEAKEMEARLREAEGLKHAALVASQRELAAELSAAVAYVHSLLPAPLTGDVTAEWRFVPSLMLGGDAFGYHFLDDARFAVYLLDVCGHGVGATLLATAVLGALRDQRLGRADFGDPASVLSALNEEFPMDRHNDTFFSIWYGVVDRDRNVLSYASGGHPPAILAGPRAGASPGRSVHELGTDDPMIGISRGARFRTAEHPIEEADTLYVFSDGAYEISGTDGAMLTYEDLCGALTSTEGEAGSPLDRWLAHARASHGLDTFDDDVSMLRISFGRARRT